MNQRAREDMLAVMWSLARLVPRCFCYGCQWKRVQLDAFYSRVWEVLFFEEIDGAS